MHGNIAYPGAFDPVRWHVHEMLFGYVGAAIAGFLLTAVPNWTGRAPLQGVPLVFLLLLWLAGRVAVFYGAVMGAWVSAAIDLAFLAAVAAYVLREILAGGNRRNLPVAGAVALLAVASAAMHAEPVGLLADSDTGMRLGIAIVTMLISVIGGRIVPAFTRNWLEGRGSAARPAPFGAVDRAALLAGLVALAGWVVAPASGLVAGLALVAAALHAWRLCRWCGLRTGAEPLVWILHIGYAWLPLGFTLLAVSYGWPEFPQRAALHAFTAGAMGTMPLAVMTRATLGHTGRPLHAGAGTVAIYVAILLAAAARIVGPLSPGFYIPAIAFGGTAWMLAFGLFVLLYAPALLGPRR
ncbi:MAG: NnrS family protein, partial [Alphaproteobacteria bacterium]